MSRDPLAAVVDMLECALRVQEGTLWDVVANKIPELVMSLERMLGQAGIS